MRRAALIAGLLVLAAVAALLLLGSNEHSRYRVAAVFDSAKGMVPGQQVKVAGAVVGSVKRVELAPGPKARVVMEVEGRFAPFRSDASCRLLPEGLISENYIECEPGTVARAELPRQAGGLPTVPVERTAVPVSLQDVINVFSLPVDQRLRVLVDELGLATAGRGEDLNALLRRANPALAQSRRVLSILDSQRRQLADAVGQTDRVLAELARRERDVRTFVGRAATVATTTAEHRTALGESVRRLPPLLDAARPALRSLDRTAASASPLLDRLRASAPGLRSLTSTLPAFARAGVPAFRVLASAARQGRRALRYARPVITRLRRVAAPLRPLAGGLARLLLSTREKGGIEGTLRVLYALGTFGSAYDGVSHMLAFHIALATKCLQAEGAGTDAPGCSHKYSAPGEGSIPLNDPSCGPQSSARLWKNATCGAASAQARRRRMRPRDPGASTPGRTRDGTRGPRAPARPVPRPDGGPPIQIPGKSPDGAESLVPLLDFLLK